MGSLMFEKRSYEDWAAISTQNRWQGVIFGADANARIFPRCVGLNNGKTYNQYWSVQNKGTVITQKIESPLSKQTGDMRVYFSGGSAMTITEENGWIFARTSNAFAAVRPAWGTYTWDDANWITFSDDMAPVIMEVWPSGDFDGVFTIFRYAVFDQTINVDAGGVLTYTGLKDGGDLTFYTQSADLPKINGTAIDIAPNHTYQSPFLNANWNSSQITIQKDDRTLELDFDYEPTQDGDGHSADLNNDGIVDMLDFAILVDNWLLCTTPGEPDCLDAR
jgi:hypothetical protein